MPFFFALTMFVSALLLFLVQPMVGKMILPLLGGTPAVWNTCMVFFQALLLAGYYYAHKVSTTYEPQRQTSIHVLMLVVPIAVMLVGSLLTYEHSPIPIVKSLSPQGSDYPFFGIIVLLFVAIGFPFFVLSTTAPLLQKWFAATGHPSAKDPYFLYGASNAGSLLSLLAYPVLIEPELTILEQAWIFGIGYLVLAGLIWGCARAVRNAPPPKPITAKMAARIESEDPPPTFLTRLRWLGLAFVPSSLMLGVTTFVSTDIASLPLLWIIPLGLYLITFIIAFSNVPNWFHTTMTLLTPVLILLIVFLNTTNGRKPSFQVILLLHTATFFCVAMTCHGELARMRPSTKYLTSFFLTMSLGGMLGGMFNSLVAPIVFSFISEYPWTMVAACLLIPKITSDAPSGPNSWIYDLIIPLIVFGVCRFLYIFQDQIEEQSLWLAKKLSVNVGMITSIVVYGIPAMVCYFFVERPLRFGLSVAAVLLASFVATYFSEQNVLVRERSFFGVLKIERGEYASREIPKSRFIREDPESGVRSFHEHRIYQNEQGEVVQEKYSEVSEYMRLVHGTTLHGVQLMQSDVWATMAALSAVGTTNPLEAVANLGMGGWEHWQFPGRDPLTYYHRTGPVGLMFDAWRAKNPQNMNVACIGLGTGSLSSYGLSGQKMTFFEIDTHVTKLVVPPTYFTYIDSARKQGVDIEFIMGDARVTLERLTDRKFGFMLIDAFSSDAIPVHLLTKESVQLYFDRLEEDGLLALHISNRYLDLEPVVARIAKELKVEARVMHDYAPDNGKAGHIVGKTSSTWIALAKTKEALGKIELGRWSAASPGMELVASPMAAGSIINPWGPLDDKDVGLWTDDFSPIMSVLRFKFNLFGSSDD